MRKFYIHNGGGLGDHIDSYYAARTWRALDKIKSEHPDVYIKAILYSANSAVPEFYRYHPLLDEQVFFDIHNNTNGQYRLPEFAVGYTPLANSDLVKQYNRDDLPMTKIYLSAEEEDIVTSLRREPYICINPFAGAKERLTLTQDHVKTLIDRLIDELHIHVILLGNSWTLTYNHSTPTHRVEETMTEHMDYERSGLTNLIGKISVRVAVALSTTCHGYIGNYTGTTHPAWIFQRKTYTCVSPSVGKMGPHDLAPYTWDSWPLMWNLPFSRMGILGGQNTPESMINDIIRWFTQD